MWLAWIAVILIADFLAFMMFAFADSPGSAAAAKLMIGPVLLWFCVTFAAGVLLLIFKGPWQIPLAFVLAISPPFLVFLGYNLLSGVRPSTAIPTATVNSPPPTPVNVPPGGFRPPASITTRPNFQDVVNKWSASTTTRPTQDE